jgi:hypothetical protein
MVITSERAYWILDYYRTRETRLAFGGHILGEEGACEAKVVHVWPEAQSIGITLFGDDEKQNWHRLIPLKLATFVYLQMGEPDFEKFAKAYFHSVLIVGFPDGTTMFLAENARLSLQ